jgi:hypothetical protein
MQALRFIYAKYVFEHMENIFKMPEIQKKSKKSL